MRRVLALVPVLVVMGAVPAVAQATSRCAEVFPDTEWTAIEGLTVDVGVAGVVAGEVERFSNEIEASAARIQDDIGGLDGVAVCLASRDAEFDTSSYVAPTRRFHALLDGRENVLALSTERVGAIKPGAAFGLAQLALWNNSGGEGWPEPLASTIAHWYRAIALDRLDQYHVQVMGADFGVDPVTGESNYGLDFTTHPRIDWVEYAQPASRTWDPSTNDEPIGDFIEYTVTQEGSSVLLDTDEDSWTRREEAWRVALLQDLTGRTTPTTGWRTGVIIAIALVIFASGVAIGGWYSKRRKPRIETPPPVPGLFATIEEPSEASRPSS
ncbi:MAG TPA: hypothetical protein VLA29_07040 [Acidimicrobiia bacterium]|nr:hypothetical protein [Acidimicrobiia bacterium]